MLVEVGEAEAIQFMLKEYDFLRDLRNDLIRTQESRITVYLTVVAASVTALGLSVSMQEKFGKDLFAIFPFISGLLALCVLLLGVITFVRMVERAIETIVAIRGINRIRLFFTQRCEDLDKHLILARLGPNEPAFWQTGALRSKSAIMVGLPQIVAILNSFVVAVAVRVIAGGFARPLAVQTIPLWVAVLGTFVFIMVLSVQNYWFWARLKRMTSEFDADRTSAR